MKIDLLATFPGCPNFPHWEAFVTDQPAYSVRSTHPKLAKTRFSPKLFAEFQALPEAEQQRIYINMCQVAILVQFARDALGFSISAESWYRSPFLNQLVGSSAPNHPDGGSFDPKLAGIQLRKFLDFFQKWGGGLGIGTKKGHVDTIRRPLPNRWPY